MGGKLWSVASDTVKLREGVSAKMDDFLEKIQTPPHIFGEKTYSLGFWGHASL